MPADISATPCAIILPAPVVQVLPLRHLTVHRSLSLVVAEGIMKRRREPHIHTSRRSEAETARDLNFAPRSSLRLVSS